jgi:uncharacterized protein (DUF1697 family)
MPNFVALLRGVNVGRANRVPMADLRQLLVGLAFEDVVTLQNSGNAIFRARGRTAARHAAAIAGALAKELQVEVPVVVKSASELAAAVAENPWAAQIENPSRLLVAFVQEPGAVQGLQAIAALVKAPERFHLGSHAAYLDCAEGIIESKAAQALLGGVGRTATSRNWATVLKIEAICRARLGAGRARPAKPGFTALTPDP